MKSGLINLFFVLLPLSGALNTDLGLATKHKSADIHSILTAATNHDIVGSDKRERHLLLTCASYENSQQLKSYLIDHSSDDDVHPTFISKSEDRVCFTHFDNYPFAENNKMFTTTMIPKSFKVDETVYELASASQSGCAEVVVEVAIGLGVQGKGLKDIDRHAIGAELMRNAQAIAIDQQKKEEHRGNFFWSSGVHGAREIAASDSLQAHRDLYRAALSNAHRCNFKDYEVNVLRSHLSITSPACGTVREPSKPRRSSSLRTSDPTHHPSETASPLSQENSCLLLLASAAAMHEWVSHVTAHRPETSSAPQSENYVGAASATDQNSWVQIGNMNISDGRSSTPYSDVGLDGSNLVLGMIDSGLDDLSCYMIDWSGTPTTRTPADQYANPITEFDRRKVIQYVAWADGEPVINSDNYDHGTWCGGASVGRCINTQANINSSSYNGLASKAQITMFDVDNNSSFLNVPSLYNIALPPAYEAGARVHSNSWGTPNMGSYTSKALDVDEYMFENPDFLFVVAAGNDGRSGFTSVHSPGVSKNALTVGAGAEDHNYLTSFSSMGYDYDNRMIKPNIVTPGTNLMSTGVRLESESESCNVQVSSGTSMATPIAAASALLIKQYFENASFWPSTCDSSYRSCPMVSSTGVASGALVKAAIIHSGQGMAGYQGSSTSLLGDFGFGTPPDKYQGWGQVLLTNVLPLSGTADFDLYVADGEEVESYKEIRYRVVVEANTTALRATLVWIDPSNVMWAAKNLLNDLDLQVISPLGNVSYGNNIKGDEFNPVERVVIDSPLIGVYEVSVTAKQLISNTQTYSIVISCDGYVDESQTSGMESVEEDLINYEEDTEACLRRQQFGGSEFELIRFQLEDWEAGASWKNASLLIYEVDKNGDKESEVFNCSFTPNADRNVSNANRVFQCAACLISDSNYVAEIGVSPTAPVGATFDSQYLRVSTPDCYNVFLSSFQSSVSMSLTGSECNSCDDKHSLVMKVLMFANVTDDDSADYTWYGLANYTIRNEDGELVAAGTLMVSDEQEDWYCLSEGTYTVALDDSALFRERVKHAMVVFSSDSGYTESVTLIGSNSSVYYLGDLKNKNSNDDDTPIYQTTGFIVGIVIGGFVFLCCAACIIKSFCFTRDKNEAMNEGLIE